MSFSRSKIKQARRPAYCYCTECDHVTILQRQQANPLPFAEAMQVHCACSDRCGHCLYPLEQLFRAEECYFE